jgi:hypothetical protein
MRPVVSRFALAAVLVGAPSVAMSQASIDQFAQFSPGSTVQYLPFNVTSPGAQVFQLFTSGANHIDPMILLFTNASSNGAGLGTFLTSNDDGGFFHAGDWNECTGTGSTCHSLITTNLASGGYTLAYGVFDLTQAEARSGSANVGPQDVAPGTSYGGSPYCNATGDWSTCNYTVSLRSEVGTVTPEPASLTLLATGLVGVFGAARRKRQARAA